MRNRLACFAAVVLLAVLLAGAAAGCAASETIVELPPPEGLPDLQQLENHLDYQDPDDGKPTYIPSRSTS